MYDKFGVVLRIESTCNNVGEFRVLREIGHRDGTITTGKAPLKKTIYSLYQLFTIMKSANYRYLEFISSFDDHSGGNGKLEEVTKPVKENGRSYKGTFANISAFCASVCASWMNAICSGGTPFATSLARMSS